MRAKNQIIVRARYKNAPVNLSVDTGAGISLVSEKFITHFNFMSYVKPTSIMITGLDRKLVPALCRRRNRVADLNILLTVVEHTIMLRDRLDNELCVGMDILTKVQANIDLRLRRIQNPKGQVEFIEKTISING